MQETKNSTSSSKPTSDTKISEKDLTLLENIIKEWYTNNSDKLFIFNQQICLLKGAIK